MKGYLVLVFSFMLIVNNSFAVSDVELESKVEKLQQQTQALQTELKKLQQQKLHQNVLSQHSTPRDERYHAKKIVKAPNKNDIYHVSTVKVHRANIDPASSEFYPTALIADNQVLTYIAGTPLVTSPYLGARPAFDGSDYIVNISSINRDIRLMEQRRRLYRAYSSIGYPAPNRPILAFSGKSQPIIVFNNPGFEPATTDLNLGANELDIAAALNDKVEAFMGIVYDATPPVIGGQRVANSAFGLSLGFVNIGNLDESPFYFTAGQLYAPFGRYSSSLITPPLTMLLARTLTRPFIIGYKSQQSSGPYAALYTFTSDTTLGNSNIGGVNLGYAIERGKFLGDFGVGVISTIADSIGMQNNGSSTGFFGGFASANNGNEAVPKVPAVDAHINFSFDRYNAALEWVGSIQPFQAQYLSFDGYGAQPQAVQLEGSMTFKIFDKPASLGIGYQWTQESLALNLSKNRATGVFNISIWKDTVESIEYRHDINYGANQYANGISSPGTVNADILGTSANSDTITAQIGVYF